MFKPLDELLGESSANNLRALVEKLDKVLEGTTEALAALCYKVQMYPTSPLKKVMESRLRDARLKHCHLMEMELADIPPYRFCSLMASLDEEDSTNKEKILSESRVLKDRTCRAISTLNLLMQFWTTVGVTVQGQIELELKVENSWLALLNRAPPNSTATLDLAVYVQPVKSSVESLEAVLIELKGFLDQYLVYLEPTHLNLGELDMSCWISRDAMELFSLHSKSRCSRLRNLQPPIQPVLSDGSYSKLD